MCAAASKPPYMARLAEQIAWYDAKASKNQRSWLRLQTSAIVLSAVTTIVVTARGLSVKTDPTISAYGYALLPIVLSAASTVAITLVGVFRHKENWLTYRATCERLRREQVMFENHAGEYRSADDPQALLVERAEAIMAAENETWGNQGVTSTGLRL